MISASGRSGVEPGPAAIDHVLVDLLNVGVFLATRDEGIRYANPALLHISGYESVDELRERPLRSLFSPPEERDRLAAVLERHGEARGFETTLLAKSGERRPVSVSAVVLEEPTLHLLGTVEDISERKRTEEQLALTRYTIDASPEPAYWFDAEGRFLYVNEAGCRALGYTRDELLRLRVGDVNPRASPARWAEVWQLLKQERKTVTLETVHRRKDGTTFPVQLSSHYFKFGGREYCNGYATDLTERRNAAEERASLESQLLQAQKMESIGRLAGGVAHDFNNMLSVILSHAELALRSRELPPRLREDLAEIRAAAMRSADLTRQLLAFARRQPVSPRVLDLNSTVEGMLNMLGRLIGEDVGLTWQPGRALHHVKLDPSQISQVLANLCVNARDAITNIGTIAIETANVAVPPGGPPERLPGDWVRLSVTDTGRGMEPSTLEHLFEPFFTTKPPGEGTGLGLSTVYGIVKQNGGFIEVRSQVGRGTTFELYLPRHLGGPEEGAPAPGPERCGRETLLLVEDEPAILRVTARLLGELGYQVLCATTADEAVRVAREHPGEIHLLLVDVVMPDVTGRDAAQRVRAVRPDIGRLYVSGYPSGVIEQRGALERGDHFLQKPFGAVELAAKVREAIERR